MKHFIFDTPEAIDEIRAIARPHDPSYSPAVKVVVAFNDDMTDPDVSASDQSSVIELHGIDVGHAIEVAKSKLFGLDRYVTDLHHSNIRWIGMKEQAALVRKRLKHDFPGAKISVRMERYAGGGAIRVTVPDDLDVDLVRHITDDYRGGSFDGMSDETYSWYSWLSKNGEAKRAYCTGTSGSVPGFDVGPNYPDDEAVRFDAKYITVDRAY